MNTDIAASLQQAIELETVKQMAIALLGSVKKELKEVIKFSIVDGLSPVPGGVYPSNFPGCYNLLTPDGLVEIFEGDFILQTLDNQFYFIRLEKTL